MDAIESVGTHLARVLPGADAGTLRHLGHAGQETSSMVT